MTTALSAADSLLLNLLKAYVFRAAYGLPGAGIENLFHAVDAALGKHDLR